MSFIVAFLVFVSIGAAIVFCAVRADRRPPVINKTDQDEDRIIDELDREKRAELLKAGGTIK